MLSQYFSAAQRARSTHFEAQQRRVAEILALPIMTTYLGKLMVQGLQGINENSFLPNIVGGRARVPRSQRGVNQP